MKSSPRSAESAHCVLAEWTISDTIIRPPRLPRRTAAHLASTGYSPLIENARAPADSPPARPASLASMRRTVPRAWIFRENGRKRIASRIARTGTTRCVCQAKRRRARGSRSAPRRYSKRFRRGPGSIHKEFSRRTSPANVKVPLLAIGKRKRVRMSFMSASTRPRRRHEARFVLAR
jgi:hypothetical protein